MLRARACYQSDLWVAQGIEAPAGAQSAAAVSCRCRCGRFSGCADDLVRPCFCDGICGEIEMARWALRHRCGERGRAGDGSVVVAGWERVAGNPTTVRVAGSDQAAISCSHAGNASGSHPGRRLHALLAPASHIHALCEFIESTRRRAPAPQARSAHPTRSLLLPGAR